MIHLDMHLNKDCLQGGVCQKEKMIYSRVLTLYAHVHNVDDDVVWTLK